MNKKPRIIFYILLNIVISALTILGVMWLWERTHTKSGIFSQENAMENPLEVQSQPELGNDQDNQITQDSSSEFISGDYDVSIVSIVGAGDINNEYVEIHNRGQGGVNLTGWQLNDEEGHNYTFPAFILNSGGAVKILSQRGSDTVIELYWQSDSAIWQSGETAQFVDPKGNVVTTYSIP